MSVTSTMPKNESERCGKGVINPVRAGMVKTPSA
jgi:hypothetical protein